RLVDVLADEERQHQLPGLDRGLRHHPAQRRSRPQTARPHQGTRDSGNLGRLLAHDGYFARALRRDAGLRSEGLATGSPAPIIDSRRAAPNSASASTSTSTSGFGAITSTRRPCSSAVFAVAGPMTAITVDGCGLPAMPTRLRTVEDEVKTTASNLPVLIASRVSGGGGAARTVRYAVTSSHSQPRSIRPATRFSVAMSARG